MEDGEYEWARITETILNEHSDPIEVTKTYVNHSGINLQGSSIRTRYAPEKPETSETFEGSDGVWDYHKSCLYTYGEDTRITKLHCDTDSDYDGIIDSNRSIAYTYEEIEGGREETIFITESSSGSPTYMWLEIKQYDELERLIYHAESVDYEGDGWFDDVEAYTYIYDNEDRMISESYEYGDSLTILYRDKYEVSYHENDVITPADYYEDDEADGVWNSITLETFTDFDKVLTYDRQRDYDDDGTFDMHTITLYTYSDEKLLLHVNRTVDNSHYEDYYIEEEIYTYTDFGEPESEQTQRMHLDTRRITKYSGNDVYI